MLTVTDVSTTCAGSFENEALENEDRSTKHPNLENEDPKTLENEAPESGGGSGCVRTSKGPQNLSQGFIRACQLFN